MEWLIPDEAGVMEVLVSAAEPRDIDHFKAAVSSVVEKMSLEEVRTPSATLYPRLYQWVVI